MEESMVGIAPPKQRKVKGKVRIDIQHCKGCGLCTEACKEHALVLSESINIKGYHYVIADNTLCTGCVNCALVCPDAVISVFRTSLKKKVEVTADEELCLCEAIPEPVI